MKKLIFCLLVLTGAGMLNSCQQDEVVNEALENKEIIIRASLPEDALSRVILDDNTAGATTSLYWETGDKIIATVNGAGYEFEVLTIGADRTTATFRYTHNNGLLPTGTCTFAYGATPNIGQEQTGTKAGLKAYHRMEASTTVTDWNAVDNVIFTTKVALVEISLNHAEISGSTSARVTLYDAKTGARLAYTSSKTFADNKVYFALPSGTVCQGSVLVEANNQTYVATVGEKTLQASHLYRITKSLDKPAVNTVKGAVKRFTHGGTTYIYGQGEIPEGAFKQQNSLKSLVVLDGVESIGSKAFHQCTGLTDVTLAASVKSIGNEAFKQSGLKNITVLSSTPPSLGDKALNQTSGSLQIYVPAGSVSTYKKASGWSNYESKIKAIQ